MASRLAARSVSRRLSSNSGKILSEEEKAAENVYIKKMEKDKMEKLAHKGAKPEAGQAAAAGKVTPEAESKSQVPIGSSSTSQASTDTNRNYAVVAGTVAIVSGLGWYLLSKPKKMEVQD